MSTIKIAIADDHELFRSGIISMLRGQEDFEVVVDASSGKDLLERLGFEAVDIVLLDVDMPEMNGTEALKLIRESYPDVRVLILTMYNHEEHMVYFLKNGAAAYLLKDMSVDEMCTAIRTAHQTGQYLTPKTSKAVMSQLNPTADSPVQLSEREIEVLKLICEEKTTTEIAEILFLSPRTIETYRKQLLEKTHSKNTAGLVKYALDRKGIY